MKPFGKQFALTVMIVTALAGCGHFGRKPAPFNIPATKPAPPVQSEVKDDTRSVQLLDGARLASLKSWDGYDLALPESQAPASGLEQGRAANVPRGPQASPPNALDTPSAARSLASMKTGAQKRVLVVGDSLSVGIGAALTDLYKSNGQVWVLEEGKVSSGLNSPNFYNWEQKLTQLVNQGRPDAVVIIIGGNDAYNGSGSAGWAQNYRKKVQKFLNIASEKGIQVYWAGLPVMRKPGFSQKVKTANKVIRSVCGESDNCRYIDTWDLVDGANHEYVHAMNLNGQNVVIRARDGTHFTFVGYKLLGKHIIAQMSGL